MTRSLINLTFIWPNWTYEALRKLTARELATLEAVWDEIQKARKG